jgi:hypothetical protein
LTVRTYIRLGGKLWEWVLMTKVSRIDAKKQSR